MQSSIKPNPFWPDKSTYFLTDSTFLHFPYFRFDYQKQIVLNQIKKLNKGLGIPISAYSIAMNHYHLKFYLERGSDLAKVKQLLRGGISHEYKKSFDVPHDQIWQSRKVIKITSGSMDWKVAGYINGNLLKHKEVNTFEELKQNKFSSFWYAVEKYGEQEARNNVCGVIDVSEDDWGAVSLEQII